MFDTINNFYRCGCGKPTGRLVPIIGRITETIGTVHKTPARHKFPLIGGDLLMTITINTVQQFRVAIQPVDKKGNPAPVDGKPEWLTGNSDALALEVAEDGMSCLVKAVGIPANATVQVTADADLGEGKTPIVGNILVEVVPAPAISINLTPGTIEDQPDSPPVEPPAPPVPPVEPPPAPPVPPVEPPPL